MFEAQIQAKLLLMQCPQSTQSQSLRLERSSPMRFRYSEL
jgi:hypothetical protein